jgi:hypothetical protein
MARINGNRKGKVGERELAAEFRRLFNVNARRGQQYNGIEGDDVVGLPGVHVECKRVEKLNIDTAVLQAKRDAKEGEIPVVFHRKNRRNWLVTLELDDVETFVARFGNLLAAAEKVEV